MKKVGSLALEVVFEKAFGQPAIFTAFVRDVLGIELEIDRVERKKRFATPVGMINTEFDFFAEDTKNRIVVEIQRDKLPDHYNRFLHYHCVALVEQAARTSSGTYRNAVQVFTIVILTDGDKYKRDVLQIDFDVCDLNGQKMGEIPHKLLFLCSKYANADTPPQYREWLQAINDSLDGEVEETDYHNLSILQVFDLILTDLMNADDRRRMMDENAHAQYVQEKEQKAVQQGRQQGLQEGVEQTAQRMLEKGMDIALVSEITGLSEDRVRELAQA